MEVLVFSSNGLLKWSYPHHFWLFSLFKFFLQSTGLVNDKDSKDSITEGENLEEDEEEEEGGAETEEQSGNESEVNEPEEEVNLIICNHLHCLA